MTQLKQILNAIEGLKEKKSSVQEEYEASWHKYREDLITQKNELERQTDKTVFTISTGAIGVSLAIIDKLALPDNYKYVYGLLAISWVVLLISIILQAISYNKTAKRIGMNIQRVNKLLALDSSSEFTLKATKFYEQLEIDNKKIDYRAKVAFVFMLTGIILLVLFSFVSLYLRKEKKAEPSSTVFFINNKSTLTWQKV